MGVKKEQNGTSPEGDAVERTETASTRKRKPYQRPEFRYERVFETMALSCGKTNSTQSQCRFNRKNS